MNFDITFILALIFLMLFGVVVVLIVKDQPQKSSRKSH